MTDATISRHSPGLLRLDIKYTQQTQSAMHAIKHMHNGGTSEPQRYPVGHWDSKLRCWYIDEWLVKDVVAILERNKVKVFTSEPLTSALPELPEDLTPYQQAAIIRLLCDKVLIAQWGVGTGKTRLGLETARHHHTTLVVVPQMVCTTWQAQVTKWAPELSSLLIDKDVLPRHKPQPRISIVSYDSLHHLPEHWSYDFLIFDELHNALRKTKRQKRLCDLVHKNLQSTRLGLTATPVSTGLQDIYAQLSVIAPYRFGTWWQWITYYHHTDKGGYGGSMRIHGLRDEHREDWAKRVASVCSTLPAKVVQDKLPITTWRTSVVECGPVDIWNTRYSPQPKSVSEAKAAWLSTSGAGLSDKTIILCYYKDTAKFFAEYFNIRKPVTGELTVKARRKYLEKPGLKVASMKSINEGIDLRQYTNVYVVEAYPVPRYMTQVLGRFVRMGAADAVTITFVQAETPQEERTYMKLQDRVRAELSAGLEQNVSSEQLMAVLDTQDGADALLAALKSGDWDEDFIEL